MRNKKETLKEGKTILKSAGIDNTKEADYILDSILEGRPCDRGEEITQREYARFIKAIKRRAKHISLDKIIGYTDFLNIRIPYSKYTLTPRQETEILADMIIRDMGKSNSLDVLDLCTGSGCLGISIAKATDSKVMLSDISKSACKVATKNALLNGVEVDIICSDLFDKIPTTFDIIVSNPPYIVRSDLEKLELEVRDFDPVLALDGGEDGLDFYRKIVSVASTYLKPNGKIYFEIGIGQSNEITKLLEKNFENICVMQDYAGIDRYIIAKKRENYAK